MKIQRRFAVIGGTILIIMVFAGLGIAEVFGAGGKSCCGPHFGPFGGGFHRCHGFGGDMPGFVLKRLDGKIEELNLTPAQKTKYDELRAHLKETYWLRKRTGRNSGRSFATSWQKNRPTLRL